MYIFLRHQTSAQKIVQARMWAQGLTVGVLIAAGILTHNQRKKAAAHKVCNLRQVPSFSCIHSEFHVRQNEDHSWVHFVEEEEEREKKQLLRLPAPAPASTSS